MFFIYFFNRFSISNLYENVNKIIVDVCYDYPKDIQYSVLAFTYRPTPEVRLFSLHFIFFILLRIIGQIGLLLLYPYISKLVSERLCIFTGNRFVLLYLIESILIFLI